MLNKDIFAYVTEQINNYNTSSIPLEDNWDWSMKEHLRRCFLLKNSKFSKGANDGSRPNNNIILPILNVAYRTEGFDVKDIGPFVNDKDNYYKSFLVKKYHPRFARKNDLDTFIDEVVESYADYGLSFIRDVDEVRPELVKLQSLAFCDQTDILKGPFAIRHLMTIDELVDQKGKWDSDKVDMAINIAKAEKSVTATGLVAKTPGKYVEVYEVHGVLETEWLRKEGEELEGTKAYTRQIQIITYYVGEDNKRYGLCLYKGKEKSGIFKALVRDPIFGRACGRSAIEELFEPQVWTNYSEIRLKDMLDNASISVIKTTDPTFRTKNKTKDLKNNEVLELEPGTDATWMNNSSAQNFQYFANKITAWETSARTIGSASEPSLGITPSSGTPLGTSQLVTAQGQGMHAYRQGKVATFFGEIYRDWILKYIVNDMNGGQKFFDELSPDELQYVVENVTNNAINRRIKAMMINGKLPTQEEKDLFKTMVASEFKKSDGKHFMEVVKDELKNLPIDVEINVTGKQKDLAARADKLSNIFRTIFAKPEVLQIPGMGDLFNDILESSGFNPISFTSLTKSALPVEKPMVGGGMIPGMPVDKNLVTA